MALVFMYICTTASLLWLTVVADEIPCMPRMFDQDSFVCVCNATYCDTLGVENVPIPFKYFHAYVTTKANLRMDRQLGNWSEKIPPNKYVFEIGNVTKQSIIGFGGAFTDAATINIHSLSANARENLITSYFGQNGIEYNIGRVPMASCDFSQRIYSYDDTEGDLNLSKFSLVEEDVIYKIPVIKDAIKVSHRNITLFGSPWSSPAWMKTNNNMTGKGTLKGSPGGEYFKAWANYFVKFIEAYREHGIDIWGVTAQNEPSDGMISKFPFQCLGWTPEMQRDFIANDLGPALVDAGFENVAIMILDDHRLFLPYWAEVVLNDTMAAKYVSGIAVHWYADLFVPPSALDLTYKQFGNKYFILNTEACELDLVDKRNAVLLGNWFRGERYFKDIMQDLKHGVSGWVDWNIALNMDGGPNWVDNRVDSPVIVNSKQDEFYKQPMFYAMGHFSKFIRPGSILVSHSSNIPDNSALEGLFFLREDGSVAANFVNTNDVQTISITIKDYKVPGYLNYDIPPKSFVTIIWYRK